MKKVLLVLTVALAVSFTSCKDDAASKVNSNTAAAAGARIEAAKKSTPNTVASQAQTTPEVQGEVAVMTFEKTEHDFGTIPFGKPVETVFKFTNTGEVPLIITDAKSTCGCTVPEKPEEPIAPGETGEIKVRFNGAGGTNVTKSVTITANTAKRTERLTIKATLDKSKTAS